jgi:hypothetical protein
MDTIWYCYRKDNGKFAGSGTPFFDNDEHGSTKLPCPEYYGSLPVFDGQEWAVPTFTSDDSANETFTS